MSLHVSLTQNNVYVIRNFLIVCAGPQHHVPSISHSPTTRRQPCLFSPIQLDCCGLGLNGTASIETFWMENNGGVIPNSCCIEMNNPCLPSARFNQVQL